MAGDASYECDWVAHCTKESRCNLRQANREEAPAFRTMRERGGGSTSALSWGQMEAVFGWVATYGYGALFGLLILGIVGLPIPDETLLVFCGYLISQGKLATTETFFTALAGTCCGITVSYIIGRTAGLAVVHRFGRYLRIDQRHLDRVHRWFEHSGHWALFGGYYIAGVRHFTAIIAGASKLEFHIFVLYAWGGAATWVAAFLTLGYVIGEQWRTVADLVHRYLTLASALGIALIVLFFAGRRWMQRQAGGGSGGA